jgi:hypothetical protein
MPTYTIRLISDPRESPIGSWPIEGEAAARKFFERLKRGNTPYPITVTLQDAGGRTLEAFRMGNDNYPGASAPRTDYPKPTARLAGTDDLGRQLRTEEGRQSG